MKSTKHVTWAKKTHAKPVGDGNKTCNKENKY